jgi:hypothetical protein
MLGRAPPFPPPEPPLLSSRVGPDPSAWELSPFFSPRKGIRTPGRVFDHVHFLPPTPPLGGRAQGSTPAERPHSPSNVKCVGATSSPKQSNVAAGTKQDRQGLHRRAAAGCPSLSYMDDAMRSKMTLSSWSLRFMIAPITFAESEVALPIASSELSMLSPDSPPIPPQRRSISSGEAKACPHLEDEPYSNTSVPNLVNSWKLAPTRDQSQPVFRPSS